MKTTQIKSILFLFAFSTFLVAFSLPDTSVKRIPLKKAIQNHQFVRAIYDQVDQSLIHNEQNSVYQARVYFNRKAYLVHGSLKEWQDFFLMDPKSRPAEYKRIKIELN